MNPAAAFTQADQLFDRVVQHIREGQWHAPTPDEGWDVHHLVQHVAYEDLWLAELAAGKTIKEVGDKYEGNILGDDAVAGWCRAHKAAQAAVSGPGDLERKVELSFGEVTFGEYLKQMAIDHTIHAWDLARAVGADEKFDTKLVEQTWEWFQPQAEGWRGAGLLGPAVEVDEAADLQTRLLALSGRQSGKSKDKR